MKKKKPAMTGFNEHIKALRFLTYWLFTIFMPNLFGSGDLTIIKRPVIVWWLLLVYCFAGNQAEKTALPAILAIFIQFRVDQFSNLYSSTGDQILLLEIREKSTDDHYKN